MPVLKCKCGLEFHANQEYLENPVYKDEIKRCPKCGKIMRIYGKKRKKEVEG